MLDKLDDWNTRYRHWFLSLFGVDDSFLPTGEITKKDLFIISAVGIFNVLLLIAVVLFLVL